MPFFDFSEAEAQPNIQKWSQSKVKNVNLMLEVLEQNYLPLSRISRPLRFDCDMFSVKRTFLPSLFDNFEVQVNFT